MDQLYLQAESRQPPESTVSVPRDYQECGRTSKAHESAGNGAESANTYITSVSDQSRGSIRVPYALDDFSTSRRNKCVLSLSKLHRAPTTPTLSTRRGFNLDQSSLNRVSSTSILDQATAVTSNPATRKLDLSLANAQWDIATVAPLTLQRAASVPLTPPNDVDLSNWLLSASKSYTPTTASYDQGHIDNSLVTANHEATQLQESLPTAQSINFSSLTFAGLPWVQTALDSACTFCRQQML